ncbi:hypothetical protein COCOBI_13-2380 [Coccomyxa sp. Obi]|nr:hypothetical protein COCOBI_13-2380 [Coccomyxa sp. Obi]
MDVVRDLQEVIDRLSREHQEGTLKQDFCDKLQLAQQGSFSFLRTEGLQQFAQIILKGLLQPEAVALLLVTLDQLALEALQVLQKILQQTAVQREATISSDADGRGVTEDEQCAALKVLEVMCLLSAGTRELAVERGTLEFLLGKLEADVVDGTLAGACLDALLALLADSNANQAKFLELGGVGKVCSVLLHQHSPSCQILCCKAINLLVTHILGPHADAAAEELERQMGKPSAELLASPIHWTQRGVMEMQLQHLATSALAKLPT